MRNMQWTVAGLLFSLVLTENVSAIEWQLNLQWPLLSPLQSVWPPWDHFYRVFLTCSGIPFVTRQEWGARPPRDPPKRLRVQPVRLLFVHHTTEDECLDFASCSAKMRYWQDFHMNTRGWDDLGYSFLIGGDGRVYVSRGWDRSGRHTFGYNNVALAVSFMGDFSRRLPSRAALWSLYRLIQCGLAQGKIHPSFTLHGHRDANCGTTCPGDALYTHIGQWPHYGGRFEDRICPPRNETKVPCIPIVSRSEWRARPWRQRRFMRPSRQAQHVFIHHTAGRNCYNASTCEDRMRSYQDYHMDKNTWWDIGYNFVVGGDGRVYQGCGFGVEGAHTLGHNRDGLGIALTGDFRNVTPSPKMLSAARRLIECGVREGHIKPDYQLHGHKDAMCTECPGTMLYEIIKKWPHYTGRLANYRCGN
ncbi:peptidoglycan recognition protein 3-like [Haemaphysalis longicornis]